MTSKEILDYVEFGMATRNGLHAKNILLLYAFMPRMNEQAEKLAYRTIDNLNMQIIKNLAGEQ